MVGGRRFRGLVVVFALFGALMGCGTAEESTEPSLDTTLRSSTFVGEVPGLDAFVGVVVRDDGTVLAYLCDGKKIGAWSTGALDGFSGSLTSPSRPAVVEVALDAGGSSAKIETSRR